MNDGRDAVKVSLRGVQSGKLRVTSNIDGLRNSSAGFCWLPVQVSSCWLVKYGTEGETTPVIPANERHLDGNSAEIVAVVWLRVPLLAV